jgi:3-hydroxyacyl-CoA dehydrogenase/enoyl-CoA hydratase/3-hydroxybutyryl-CoA epimerase
MAESDMLEKMVKDNRLGKKNKKGFYRYDTKKKQVDPVVKNYIAVKERTDLQAEELVKRMVYPMINEAARCMEDQIVNRPQDVDLAMIFGTGFAPFRGGLLTYADSQGLNNVVQNLENFASNYSERFTPSDMLMQINKSGKSFYEFFNH